MANPPGRAQNPHVYSPIELGIKLFASRCCVLFDSYIPLLRGDEEELAKALYTLEGSYEDIVGMEKNLIEKHLGRGIREHGVSKEPIRSSEPTDEYGIWKVAGHIVYLPNGYKIVKDDDGEDEKKNPPPKQPESASIPAETPPETPPETPTKEAPAQPRVGYINQLLRDTFENFKDELRKKAREGQVSEEYVNTFNNGLDVFLDEVLRRSGLVHMEGVSQASDLRQEAESVFHTAIETFNAFASMTPEERAARLGTPVVPIINDRLVAYNEATAPNFPPNPYNHMYASYGTTSDLSLPCHEVVDTNVMWQTHQLSQLNISLPPNPNTAPSYPNYQKQMNDSLKKMGHELGIDRNLNVLFYEKLMFAIRTLERETKPMNTVTKDDIDLMKIKQLSLSDTYNYVKYGRLANENSQPIGPSTEFEMEQKPMVQNTVQNNWGSRRRRRTHLPSTQRNWEPPTDIQPFTMGDTTDPEWCHRFVADWVRRFVQKQFCKELGLENISLPFAQVIWLSGVFIGQKDFDQTVHEWLNRADKKAGDKWDVDIKWTARGAASSENDKNENVSK
ncbi:hypothetical protein B9Z55_023598 [Caenorhabditis nigoni]|uniref:Uncharacterized protein n=1 Tax=Caenorhabditis nigoni TaxID=1611254 RepID=A0A2G5SR51_9PELO|nr:hypothetical protein B9Z55_023598 [Caenorhabditis nigoni]